MIIKSKKQAKAIINKACGDCHAAEIKDEDIQALVGATVTRIGGDWHVQGSYYRKLTERGFVNAYGILHTWEDLYRDGGEIADKYSNLLAD